MQRESHSKKNADLTHYLILGTVYNPPTRMGMEILINWINNNATPNCFFTIAGYGTEIFRNGIISSNVEVLGSLNSDEMENAMTQCDALLVYQIATTGVLTRVVEFNVAGIPVILNAEAAYSFLGMEKVDIYNSLSDLHKIINSNY